MKSKILEEEGMIGLMPYYTDKLWLIQDLIHEILIFLEEDTTEKAVRQIELPPKP